MANNMVAALRAENADLRNRLKESEEILHAIRAGEVDAITVQTSAGFSVFTLKGAEQPYREMVETMSEGAITVGSDDLIIYCNQRFANMLKIDLQTVLGTPLVTHFAERHRTSISATFDENLNGTRRITTELVRGGGPVPVTIAICADTAGRFVIIVTDMTEVIAAQGEITKSSILLENILQSSIKYSILGTTLERDILFWNEGARRNYGYTSQEIIGQTMDILYAPEHRGSIAVKNLMETAQLRGMAEGEFERIRKDGTRFPAQTVVTRRDDVLGNPIGYLLISSDISDRRKAEADLQESFDVVRTLTSAMPQMVWMCTPDGLNTYFNQQWVDYTGLTLEESYGRGWITPFHPDDQQAASIVWKHAIETGQLYRIESRLRAADGSYRWFLMRGAPVINAEGTIVKWCGNCTDIDDLKRAEEQLRSISQYARSLLEACLDPLITISPDGMITDVNHATELITGQIRERLIGSDFAICFTESERARSGYQRVFTKGFLIDTRLAIRHVAGTVTEVLCNASLYRDGSGRVAGVFLVARDISRMLPAELMPSPKRRNSLWRHVGIVTAAAAFVAIATMLPTISRTWLRQQENQYDFSQLMATSARMQTLLHEIKPMPARVQAAWLHQSSTSFGLGYTITYAVAAPNHDRGFIGKEQFLSRFANEISKLSTGNCVHPPLTTQDVDLIVCPIAGKTGLLGLLFMSWDRGDPVPANFYAATTALKQAGSDIAGIWFY